MSPGSVGDAESVLSPDVYVSDDGGYSWLLALRGPHHYAILDSGGLLVAVEHTSTPVNQLKSVQLGMVVFLICFQITIGFQTLSLSHRSLPQGFPQTRASAGTRTTSPASRSTSAAWTASPAPAP